MLQEAAEAGVNACLYMTYVVAGAGFDTDSPDSWEWEDIELVEAEPVAG